MPSMSVNDGHESQQIFYHEAGSGDPVLLLHGWTEINTDMAAVGQRIAAFGYRVIMPDRPGYGQSVPPYRNYMPEFYPHFYARDAHFIALLLDALGITSAHIIGFSDGGETALLIGVNRPALCKSVIVWGAIGAYPARLCEYVRAGLPPTWITDDIRARHPGQNVDHWPYQWVDAFCAIIAAGGDVSLSKAGKISAPLLLMLGDQDGLNPVEAGQTFVDATNAGSVGSAGGQNAILEVFPGVAHAIHEEQPEAFIYAIRAFWKRHGLLPNHTLG